jgi:serine/threonine protein kinase
MLIGSAPDSTLHATLKILDIGLGRTLFDEGAAEASVDAGLTIEGVLLGTPDYMAPEQARDPRTADIRADIYSLGCILYHLLTGQLPFPDTNLINQMIRHATEMPKPLKLFNPTIPEGLQQILNVMLAKDTGQRYPTPDYAAQALQAFLATGIEQLAEPESDPQMRPYLNWLETESGNHPVTTAAKGASVPKPPSGKLPATTKTPRSSKEERNAADASDRPRKHARKKHRPPHRTELQRDPERARGASAPQDAAQPVGQVDVELVPMNLPAVEAKPVRRWHLNRREMFVFAIGALLGAIVTFLGALLAFKNRE